MFCPLKTQLTQLFEMKKKAYTPQIAKQYHINRSINKIQIILKSIYY